MSVCVNQSKGDVKAVTSVCLCPSASVTSVWVTVLFIRAVNWLKMNIFNYASELIIINRDYLLGKDSFAHQGCIYLIKNTVKSVILWNIITMQNNCFLFEYILKYNLFLECKSEFLASLLLSAVSHDPSEIILICWFAAQKMFLMLKTSSK